MTLMKKRTNPNKRPATQADVERARAQGRQQGVLDSAVIMLTVLRDKEGFEPEDLQRFWREIGDLSDSIVNGYASISDMKDVLKQEIGAWVF
jgi:hypothetical protein